MWSEPIPEPVHFLDSPFTCKRINCESIATKVMDDFFQEDKMVMPGCGKCSKTSASEMPERMSSMTD